MLIQDLEHPLGLTTNHHRHHHRRRRLLRHHRLDRMRRVEIVEVVLRRLGLQFHLFVVDWRVLRLGDRRLDRRLGRMLKCLGSWVVVELEMC